MAGKMHRRLYVSLTDEQFEFVRHQAAFRFSISDSEFVRRCIDEAIQQQPSSTAFGCGELQERFRRMRIEKQQGKDAKREAARIAKRDAMRAKRAAIRVAAP